MNTHCWKFPLVGSGGQSVSLSQTLLIRSRQRLRLTAFTGASGPENAQAPSGAVQPSDLTPNGMPSGVVMSWISPVHPKLTKLREPTASKVKPLGAVGAASGCGPGSGPGQADPDSAIATITAARLILDPPLVT